MGRTLRKRIRDSHAAPFLTYIIRKWHIEVIKIKNQRLALPVVSPLTQWADDDDDSLPPLPPEWLSDDNINKSSPINHVKEYNYKNS